MHLAAPLRSIAPTLDGVVLTVLAGTQGSLSATQVAKLADSGSRTGLTLALDRLVDSGLVLGEPANRGVLYRLNRDHVLASAVAQIVSAAEDVAARMAQAVGAWDEAPVHAGLFGSFARGEAATDSDIDLLLVPPTGATRHEVWDAQVEALAQRVAVWTGNDLEVVVMTREDLAHAARAREPLLGEIRADTVTIAGIPFARLMSEVDASLGA